MARRLLTVVGIGMLTVGCGDATDPFGSGNVALFTDVAAGAQHTCGVTEGRVFCWGDDMYGQAGGQGSQIGGPWPVQVPLPAPAATVTAGQRHSCALMADGQAYCWGWNHLGQLGPGYLGGILPPEPVDLEEAFTGIDAGWNHTCGVAGERAYCWGSGGQGRLGDGADQDRSAPVQVVGDQTFVQITAGGHHSCGVAADGTAYCWGLNHMGQLGTGTTASSAVPVPVAGDDRFERVAAGFTHTCGVLVGGGVKCWGSNVHGELGNAAYESLSLPGSVVPERVIRIDGLVRVDAGAHFTCGSLNNGETWCWGRGTEGQLAAGHSIDHTVPQLISGVAGAVRGGGSLQITKLALGTTHTCGLSTVGIIFCWGTGRSGELGNRRITYTNIPIRVDGR
jgi:alpha-tubulin suppressor-like RCC1 family protein